MGSLTGYTISINDPSCGGSSTGPSTPSSNLDHTYVRSDQGDAWGCYGRNDCGNAIVSGGNSNDVNIAKCLAEPNGTAAIIYLYTGVCHQCSNRILYPANVTVSAAHGYAASVALYGTYGKDYPVFYANVLRCGGSVIREPIPVTSPSNEEENERKHHIEVLSLYSKGGKDIHKTIAEDLGLLIQNRCKNKINKSDLMQIKNSHVELLKKHDQLIKSMDSGNISQKDFIAKTMHILEDKLYQFEKIMGEKEFLVTFGASPDAASKIFELNNIDK
ncbi:hypothetical protein EXW29_09520 [Bacillus toyonensis]|uniref:hypothetical protein n=1 Tax=Bacillus toyonensis TaxID=155322 RepID=UPI001C0396B3|nr:hypothetical protein [Bacillus toyonensis]QWH88412.1 hypothetical protein EXW29_09520 [Bacillus toyonensis]QWI31587.1 hypothetical protein EXW25_09510 [Bacillus toyonensis]